MSSEQLYVNADWSALVPAGSAAAAFGITEKDAKRRGLLPLEDGEQLEEPVIMTSANLTPAEPEAAPDEPAEADAKQAPKPRNKMARRPADK